MLEAGQSSTAMSEAHSRPTMSAYSEQAEVYGSQPNLPVMTEKGAPVINSEDAPGHHRQQFHRQLTGEWTPPPHGLFYNSDEEEGDSGDSDVAPGRVLERERQYKQDVERREANSKPMKRSYPGTPQDALLRDHKGAAAKFSEDYTTREARYPEQRNMIFGRPQRDKPTRNSRDSPERFLGKKLKYTISEDLTQGRSRRLRAKYLALECSQSSSLYALPR